MRQCGGKGTQVGATCQLNSNLKSLEALELNTGSSVQLEAAARASGADTSLSLPDSETVRLWRVFRTRQPRARHWQRITASQHAPALPVPAVREPRAARRLGCAAATPRCQT